jgi:Ni/Co efflux regulator RcnB
MRLRRLAACTLLGLLAAGSAFAEKPSWAGGGKAHGHGASADNPEGHDREAASPGSVRFGPEARITVREYYAAPIAGGKCPPGLAKKNNGCLPPGQAKKWAVGQPLPPGVVYYAMPPDLLVRLPPPPRGYRYVRVAGDVLLIAIGTSMVLDAIQDLGRL